MPDRRRFHQLDVFSDTALRGNALAVVHDATGLSDDTMAAIARWTNLSETAFLLPPDEGTQADYRVRIFTPQTELPFAGHPTLGSCHAWLAAGGQPVGNDIVQQCGIGLVHIRRKGTRLAFLAPPLLRAGPLDEALVERIAHGLRIARTDIVAHQWVDNGPGWAAVLLPSAGRVLAVEPDWTAMAGLKLGLVGPCPAGSDTAFEVRAFVPGLGVPEDPVTGSLNAGLAHWLTGTGVAPHRYVVSQGTAVGRAGRVHVERIGDDIWVGGDVTLCIEGTLLL